MCLSKNSVTVFIQRSCNDFFMHRWLFSVGSCLSCVRRLRW